MYSKHLTKKQKNLEFLWFFALLQVRQCCSTDCALALVTHHFVCATVHVSIVRLRLIDLSLSPLPISLGSTAKSSFTKE